MVLSVITGNIIIKTRYKNTWAETATYHDYSFLWQLQWLRKEKQTGLKFASHRVMGFFLEAGTLAMTLNYSEYGVCLWSDLKPV